ncbi:MAG TPA: hypothetical protein IAB04_05445 [Candidatus Avimonoglobus intestinipullorum]|uniref:Uncharacterized protein n=1 Tax=Candidatus Avimonoglobus intestinipullorum TaxID=2840699 RepID=A0A9D1S6Z4_9FIRM|nr:hypothetical protein [Candidatus Avimonoglobus intestinipullorum]
MDTPITRAEHEEFRRRLEEENRRQDKRIELLEENTKRIETLNGAIGKLAANMEGMLKEQLRQGQRLELLESRDGELWRKVVSYAVTAIVGIVIGFVAKQLGM